MVDSHSYQQMSEDAETNQQYQQHYDDQEYQE